MFFSTPDQKLRKAIKKGDLKAVQALLDQNVDVNKKNDEGHTPLIVAVRWQASCEVIKALLDKGARLDEKTEEGQTALICAIHRSYTEAVDVLLDKGANPNEKDADGNPVLTLAAGHSWNWSGKMMQLLLDKGADPNGKNEHGMTALMVAANECADLPMINLLLKNGAHPEDENEYGVTAQMIALSKGHMGVAKILEDALEKKKPPEDIFEPMEKWVMMGSERIAFIGAYPEAQKRLTHIFNFAGRERLTTIESMKTGGETAPLSTRFDDLLPQEIERAFRKFSAAGGVADEDFVLRGITHIVKKGPG